MSEDMKELAQQSANNQTPARSGTLGMVKSYLGSEAVKKRFEDILKDKAPAFMQSIVSLASSNTNFNGVDPNTIIQSALEAATLDLPINPNLGFAYVIPYGRKASFQIGAKGFTQLALRTGQYKTINATEVYEGELVSKNKVTGEIVLNETLRASDKIVGYCAYFKLANGYEQYLYMTVEELVAHGKRFSKSYSKGLWTSDPHSMMMKTVIKRILSKFGPLSTEMQRAMVADQAVITEEDGIVQYDYEDNPNTEEATVEEVADEEPKDIDWESPGSIIEAINGLYIETLPGQKILGLVNEFKKENKKRLECFGGPDEEKIKQAIEEAEKKALGKKDA